MILRGVLIRLLFAPELGPLGHVFYYNNLLKKNLDIAKQHILAATNLTSLLLDFPLRVSGLHGCLTRRCDSCIPFNVYEAPGIAFDLSFS
jgi:hypothetical protein